MGKKRIFYGWIVAFCCMLLAFSVNAMGNNGLSLYITPISEDLLISRTNINTTLLSVGLFSRTIFGLFYGKLSNRFGIKRLMFIGCLLALLAYFIFYKATNMFMIALGSGIYGITHSIGTLSAYNTIINNWFNKRKGLVLGLIPVSVGLGGIVISPLVGGWIKNFGWNMSLLLTGIIIGVIAIPAISLIRISPKEMGLTPYGEEETLPESKIVTNKTDLLGLKGAIHTLRFWFLVFVQLFFGLCFGPAFSSVTPTFIALGTSPEYVYGVLMVLVNVGVVIGSVTSGLIYDKYGLRTMILLIGGILGSGMILMILPSVGNNYIISAITVLCIGYGNAMSLGTLAHYINNVFGFDSVDFSALFGTLFAVHNVGNMIGSPIYGRIFDLTGSYKFSYLLSASTLALTLVLASIVIGMGKRKQAEKERIFSEISMNMIPVINFNGPK